MAGGAFDSDTDAICDINVTPLVDVVLVLLVLFMVTAPMIAARGILVDSPKTVSGNNVDVALKITATPEGDLFINDKKFSSLKDPGFKKDLDLYIKDHPGAKAVIAADKTVPHGEVMNLIDTIKLAGITKFALLTSPKKQ